MSSTDRPICGSHDLIKKSNTLYTLAEQVASDINHPSKIINLYMDIKKKCTS